MAGRTAAGGTAGSAAAAARPVVLSTEDLAVLSAIDTKLTTLHADLATTLHADVAGVPIQLTKVGEGPALGSAMLAAVGAGIYADLAEAAAEMVHTDRTIEPDQARHDEYAFWVDRYTELYPQVKDVMHQMSRHVGGHGQR